ncbi:MAG: signal peptide peptidase SppA [Bacteroidales bacterium]|nr:signal peptide peptidase SppA [Bacteroidales bacterium]
MKTFWKIVFGSLLGCIVALVIFGFIFLGMVGSLISFSDETIASVPSKAILKIDFNTGIAERNRDMNLNLDVTSLMSGNINTAGTMSILSAIRAIETAAFDPAIEFIYINTDKMAMSMSHIEELRGALKDFRESGKAVVTYGNTYSTGSYYLASVSDKIIINKGGESNITGIGTNVMFFKGILDKLGVKMQLIRHGKYKSAGEQYVADEMSPANREQNEAMIASIWNSWNKEIAASRDFSCEDLDNWINNLELSNAESLIERKLVDEAFQPAELNAYLCSLFNVSDSKNLKFVDLATYAKARVKENTRAKEKIAILYADGEIVMRGDDTVVGGAEFAMEIEKLRKDSTIKAVVFRVNSPGGSAQAAEMIRSEIELLAKVKPVIASYGGYAASGGYWISAGAHKIFTDNSTLTGSIGVFSLIPDIGSALNKTLNVKTFAVTTHKHGDMLSGMRSLDESEQKYMQDMVENIYSQFTSIVAEGRSMSVEAVDEIAQGRVWAGGDAIKIGLADEIGDLTDAIRYAAAAANLSDYKIVEAPIIKTSYEKIMETISKGASISLLESTYSFLKDASEPSTYARMPYIYLW